MKKATTKKVTIDDLAVMMSKGFSDVNKKIDNDINNLAIMVAKGFEGVYEEIRDVKKDVRGVKEDIVNVKKDIAEVKENLAGTRRDVLSMGDKFTLKYELHDLASRVVLLEQKQKVRK